ncbi:AMP-binding protein [Geodermatophilus sp. DSM 44513]|uniref:AMP-binding protein n=1 Tax=Geodermatophilus sp. DSM 44513 TaxID=1528104 RepID=UPI001AA152D6|nr:AMP-binding protein [Geodermatophilus sp. DSM 44513]WNV74281.1 AMP-binding protein [Geodermatophilus sp. DSM 44513]
MQQRVEELVDQYSAADLAVAEALCDRHPADRVAVTVVRAGTTSQDLSYGELRRRSEQLAGGLARLGVRAGTRVATLLPKGVELPITLLAMWRLGAVHVPLFTAFGAQAIALRLAASGAELVVCDSQQRPKLDAGPDMPADPPWRIVVLGADAREGDIPFDGVASGPARAAAPHAQGPEGPVIQFYTSGTTGNPKGVVVPARALAGIHAYYEFGLDVRADDVYWNAADPGWAYGLFYAVVAPLAAGRRTILLDGPFAPELFLRVLRDLGVSNLAAAPTAFRAVRSSGLPIPDRLVLRAVSSAGEPLTPDIIEWSTSVLGVPVHDHFGQTEVGMVVANSHHPELRAPLRPASMGRALPGFTAVVLDPDADVPAAVGTVGRVALDVPASPLFCFTGYHQDAELTAQRYAGDGRYYLTGDSGHMDADGFLFFTGRDDDVILSAGYRIGPFDVESVLCTHQAVAECAVVGLPDQLRGEVVTAFVVLRQDTEPSEALADELQTMVRTRYAAHAYPRRIDFVPALPKTPSGKVQRFLLRQHAR